MHSTEEITKIFIDFFAKRGHKIMPSASLIPKDESVLLTSAGMQPFIPYFSGQKKPPAKKMTNIQKCFRTVDIEDVGYNKRTLTFFMMLGSWSIGDYFKDEAIKMAWEILTSDQGGYAFDSDKLWITVFEGDKDIPADEESIKLWQAQGVSTERIVKLSAEHNVWAAGDTGPRGASTEIFYDQGEDVGCKKPDCRPGCDCDRFLEIWNLVFMSHERLEDGTMKELPFRSVDTGAGLERFAAVLQNKKSVVEIDVFQPLVKKIEQLADVQWGQSRADDRSISIIADHLRGACFLAGDGVEPGKEGRGYIIRRIIRRAVGHARKLDITETDLTKIVPVIGQTYEKWFKESDKKISDIKIIIAAEIDRFLATMDKGLNILDKYQGQEINGEIIFDLYATYGLPTDLVKDLAKDKKIKIADGWGPVFDKKIKEHQQVSRAGAEKKFGGVGKLGNKVARQHTATHLLQQALRDVLGDQVEQRGSDLTEERLRFDFTYDQKLTPEQKDKVESIVNEKIKADLPVVCEELPLEEAKKTGAIGLFDEKYGDKVKVYLIGDPDDVYSKEFCGGPHVKRTGELGSFKIKKEESSSAGVRRIKAVLG